MSQVHTSHFSFIAPRNGNGADTKAGDELQLDVIFSFFNWSPTKGFPVVFLYMI